ncbi:MAG TPA: alcohol dehydrogenase catalytic domain-containing protein [Actinomycetota bacterium]
MRAVVFEAAGVVRVDHVPDPVVVEPTDAVVRVTRSAICGSDLHFFHLKAPVAPGDVLGHEAVGVVESVGRGVTTFAPGDRVVVAFDIACGTCWFCQRGQTQLCERSAVLGAGTFGGDLPGAQAERVRVPWADTNLLAIPNAVDDDRALFVGDILTTAVYAASLAAPGPDDVVAIVGMGPVGLLCVQTLRAIGARTVLALDREHARLAMAQEAGAVTIDVGRRNPQSAVDERTEGRGADVVIDAVGHPEAYGSAVSIVRRGGRVVVVGMYTGETVDLQLGVYWARALDVRFAGICPVHAWWRRAMDLVADGSIDPTPLISHRLSLDEAPSGYALFDRREATKVVLTP